MEGFSNLSALLHCGVYGLTYRGVLVYVGKSKKPLQGVHDHWKRLTVRRKSSIRFVPNEEGHGKDRVILFDGFWFVGCMLNQLDELEQAMIKKYNPRYNQRHAPVVKVKTEIRLEVGGRAVVLNGSQPVRQPFGEAIRRI